MKFLITAAALTLAAASAQAAPKVSAAWSRPAAQGSTGAGYMTLSNAGPADALVAAESPLSGHVMIHHSSIANGMASMKMVARVPVAAGRSVTFAPGGYHLMFMGLTKALNVGDTLPATLVFASGARVKASFVVGLAPPVRK
ncbi:MAG: copper chaperone PCu(A)C [Phenylobacterium sp.]|uniref:copper chaperone PCu(A)C n=1 Tax=Phenylobacterium sp. TaxID=1871053 RepID=UPI001A58EA5D|nr:copper chaperone PCu(A)C [Phenylobacterium sp.]MBL8554359.1 copper chaperone PCu(A)C [Phenylobacterium sp.]